MSNKQAYVLGSGLGGIASALRAKKKGFDVTLFEKNSQIGGRSRSFNKNGFYHDAGPTVITAPWLFEELFSLFNKDINDYVTIKPLDIWYRYIFWDGSSLDHCKDIDKTLSEINKFSQTDSKNYLKLLDASEKIFNVGFTQLATVPFHNFFSMLKLLPKMIKLKSYLSVWDFVSKFLENDKIRRAFTIHPLLVGGNPFNTTSIYNLIHFLERKWGIHFVMGGTAAMVKNLEKLMIEEGITIRKNTEITKINLNDSKKSIKNIEINHKEKLSADIYISNMDPSFLEKKIINGSNNFFSGIRNKHSKFSMGLFVIYFGSKVKYEKIAHHTIILSKRYKELLSDIFNGSKLPEDFSLYLHRPTATDPSLAPQGCDSFYVLSPVPNLKVANIDWKNVSENYAKKILSFLGKDVMPGLMDNLDHFFWMSPNDFKNDYNSMYGAGFSIAPIFYQSAWFRYHNKSQYDNLYQVGAGCHPGAGVPGVLSSAKIVEKLI